MEINLIELWVNMGFAVKCVVLALTAQAIFCVVVIIDRIQLLRTSTARAREFVGAVQPAMDSHNYAQVLAQVESVPPNHLTSYLELGLRSFFHAIEAGENSKEAAEVARRALERKGEMISRDVNKGMNVLASTGSTAPFVGLLGTVLGIINAFKLIASSGSGGLGTIGVAIAEALVVTGYGLLVAIPSVLVFNWLSNRIATYESGLVNAGGELLDRLQAAWRAAPPAQTDGRAQQPAASASGRPGVVAHPR